MKIFSYLLILGSVLSLALCEIQKIGSVYELTDNDYQKFIEENAIVMLKLYSRKKKKKKKKALSIPLVFNLFFFSIANCGHC